MSTDPFVAAVLDDAPRQEPNLAPGVRMPPAHAWRADRPGDLADGQPRGLLLGSPGPNVGYALSLVHRVRGRLQLAPHEQLENALAVVGEVAMKRAASYGRAPVSADVECAALALGYLGDAPEEFRAWRAAVVDDAAHDYGVRRALCDAVPLDALRLVPSALELRSMEVREQVRSGLADVDAH
jgi:hypothetical protein